jgi:hypothetical protein
MRRWEDHQNMRLIAIAAALVGIVHSTPALQAYTAESKTVSTNGGSAAASPLATRLFLDAGVTAAPLGTVIWFVADKNGDGVPTSPAAGSILGADDELVFRDVLDGDQPGSSAGRYRRLDIAVPDSLRGAAIYMYLWNGSGIDFVPVSGSRFGLHRFGVVPPPEVGNAPWLIDANVNASQYQVGGSVANRAPVFNPVSPQVVTNGTELSFTVSASDPDSGQTLSYSLDSGAPLGAAVDAATGVFRWTPSSSDVGIRTVVFRATDSGAPTLSATLEVGIEVRRAYVPPPAPTIALLASAGSYQVRLEGVSGSSYQLQARTSLTEGTWVDVGNAVVASGSTVVLDVVQEAAPTRFLRVVAR